MTTTTMREGPREPRDPAGLDDSWFDRPGRTLQRSEVPAAQAPTLPDPSAGRDDSVELDDPWFREDGWR